MAAENTFTLPLNQFTKAGKDLLAYVQLNPALFGIAAIFIVAGVVTIVVPVALGFGAAGPIAGSIAAAWQASIGNVVAGTLFATLQSLTMTGVLVDVGGVLIGVGIIAGLTGVAEWAMGVEWSKNVDWSKGGDWSHWAYAAGMVGNVGWARCEELARSYAGIAMEAGARAEAAMKNVDWDAMAKNAKMAWWRANWRL